MALHGCNLRAMPYSTVQVEWYIACCCITSDPTSPSAQLVMKAIAQGNQTALADARRIGQYGEGETPADAKELA